MLDKIERSPMMIGNTYYCKSLGTLSGFQLSSYGMSKVVMVRCIQ